MERVEEMMECLFRFYPSTMCAISRCKRDYFIRMAGDYELKILRLQIQLAEMELKYHKAEIKVLWSDTSYSSDKNIQSHQIDIRRLKDEIKRFQSRVERMKEKMYG